GGPAYDASPTGHPTGASTDQAGSPFHQTGQAMSQQTSTSQQTTPSGDASKGRRQRRREQRSTERGNAPAPSSNGQVGIGDIKAKLSEIDAEIRGATEVDSGGKRTITLAAVGLVVGIVILAFVLGRKRGRRTSTWVEVRRL
ncbi:MAG: hypothetical protein FWC87_06100, partial [Acidimicrobiaceae bacterium]|nr:hypothetical protein [Acidimicrobiaceae bacterium]